MKSKAGRPKFKPTDEQRQEVSTLAKYGVRQDTIASALGIAVNTLKKYFETELEQGRARGDVILQETQFQRAVRDGDVSMLRWLGIHRLGQVEKKSIEHSGPNGGPVQVQTIDPTKLSSGALKELLAARASAETDG